MRSYSIARGAARAVAVPWRAYWRLCKPNVVLLVTFTAVVGMLLATAGAPPPGAFVFGALGIALAAASGAAFNHVADRHIDAVMARTSRRPLPTGEVGTRTAVLFALALGALAMVVLFGLVNPLTALLTFISLIGYAVIYTLFLKRRTPQNIVLGGAAGAAPPVLGWTAMTGQIHPEALLLFLIIFVWTPPHFWSLAIRRREDYARAGIPMLPVTHGVRVTKLQILLYTALLVAVTLLPFITHMSGLIYLAGAIALGIGFLRSALALYRTDSDAQAMRTFDYSILYLSLLFAFLLADHYARLFLRAFVL
ncbi:MAG: protoheme IX farnesyltransferase [Betaproteobacteria bacterium]|nr:protoheme IX farnesyltransferase [Betaproteobacteria bacterium]